MTLLNRIYEVGGLTESELSVFVRLLCPFAPHVCEEMWEKLGYEGFASLAQWPVYDEAKTADSEVEIAVQICGKLRGTITLPKDASEDEALAAAKANDKIASALEGKRIIKEIYVPGRIVNIVAK